MKTQTTLDGEDGARYLKLIQQGTDIGRHVELLRWLQGDVQHYLPHEILLAGWGDFEEGCVQHDIVSALPGVRSYALGTEVLPFLLAKVRERWVAERRGPCTFDFQEFRYLLGHASLPDSFCHSLHGMRSALVHGIADARGRSECIYLLLCAREIPPEVAERAKESVRVLMPFIDTALRQIAHLPQQHRQAVPPVRNTPEDVVGLSDRETQIMAWVAMGKTNSEIGTILSISGFTVKNHMQKIFQKLNVFNRAQAVSKVTRTSINV